MSAQGRGRRVGMSKYEKTSPLLKSLPRSRPEDPQRMPSHEKGAVHDREAIEAPPISSDFEDDEEPSVEQTALAQDKSSKFISPSEPEEEDSPPRGDIKPTQFNKRSTVTKTFGQQPQRYGGSKAFLDSTKAKKAAAAAAAKGLSGSHDDVDEKDPALFNASLLRNEVKDKVYRMAGKRPRSPPPPKKSFRNGQRKLAVTTEDEAASMALPKLKLFDDFLDSESEKSAGPRPSLQISSKYLDSPSPKKPLPQVLQALSVSPRRPEDKLSTTLNVNFLDSPVRQRKVSRPAARNSRVSRGSTVSSDEEPKSVKVTKTSRRRGGSERIELDLDSNDSPLSDLDSSDLEEVVNTPDAEYIEWKKLDRRIAEHFGFLEKILKGGKSHYGDKLAQDVKDGKSRNLMKAGFDSPPGYYGTRGFRAMQEAIFGRFSSLLRQRAVEDALVSSRGYSIYVQAVLVPELAVRLVMEDMGVGSEAARKILEESEAIGELLCEDIGDIVDEDDEDLFEPTNV
ncbi:unnamed protein product [Parascedosporium putredinis]|uniref:Restriction of telomere capping protein 4 n=1 Tax=Parascedosporium putredinis TaxID=1442378 RepID=A0A9P1MCB7_9PEZI|nr:unnamed protein product [Parascedosporium putredinis]CAI7997550.1 unnamed protein product [Parascedosporium putredinis]